MSSAKGLRQVGYFDCPGGGQIVVAGTTAFIGHMRAPAGTSIVDIADPAHPRLLARLEMPPGTHSHKVRVRRWADADQSRAQSAPTRTRRPKIFAAGSASMT